MADYNGDTEEDCAMNAAFTYQSNLPDESFDGKEIMVAADYFQWGWEAAMKFMEKHNETNLE